MKVTLAPVESLVLKQAAEQLKLNGEEVIELSQKDLQEHSEASVESVLANTDSLVINLPFATEFVQSLVRLHRAKPEALEGKLLVGISSIVTWGKTTGENVTEADESRRIPIPGALPLLELERLLMTCSNSHIICHGILYGAGECDKGLKPLFDGAFHDSTVTIYGKGDNKVPLVHVNDVVKFVELVLSSKLSKRYSLVVDEVENTLEEVTGSIAEAFGAEIKRASHNDLIFMDNAADIEHLFLDLQMECTKVDDYVFQFSSGFVSELKSVAAEYTEALSYSPRAYFLIGPPCAGKTYFAKGLCKKYGLEYISREQVELLQKAVEETETTAEDNTAEKEKEKEKEEISVAMAFNQIMGKPVIENKGYVLDGFPATIQEAYELFPNPAFQERESQSKEKGGEKDETAAAANEEEKEEEEVQKLLYPNLAVYVKADDPILQERADMAGVETADFNGRYNTFKKSSEEDKKNFQEQLKKLDEAIAKAKEGEEEEVQKSEEEEQKEKEKRAKIEEITQTSSLTAYFTLMGSKYMDVDNNRKEVVPVPADVQGEENMEGGEGNQGEKDKEEAEKEKEEEKEEEFSPLQHLVDRIEGNVVDEKDVSPEETPKAEDKKEDEGAAEEKEDAEKDTEEPKVETPEPLPAVETRVSDISQVEDMEALVKPVKAYLASQLAPAISKGFIKLIEEKPENPIKFLGEFLIEQSTQNADN